MITTQKLQEFRRLYVDLNLSSNRDYEFKSMHTIRIFGIVHENYPWWKFHPKHENLWIYPLTYCNRSSGVVLLNCRTTWTIFDFLTLADFIGPWRHVAPHVAPGQSWLNPFAADRQPWGTLHLRWSLFSKHMTVSCMIQGPNHYFLVFNPALFLAFSVFLQL